MINVKSSGLVYSGDFLFPKIHKTNPKRRQTNGRETAEHIGTGAADGGWAGDGQCKLEALSGMCGSILIFSPFIVFHNIL